MLPRSAILVKQLVRNPSKNHNLISPKLDIKYSCSKPLQYNDLRQDRSLSRRHCPPCLGSASSITSRGATNINYRVYANRGCDTSLTYYIPAPAAVDQAISDQNGWIALFALA
jgi:hypothetical protein